MSWDEDQGFDEEASEGGYLMSVSDMMAGLLFVFMITLMVFVQRAAAEHQRAEERKVRYEQRYQAPLAERERLLRDLQRRLVDRGIPREDFEVNFEQGTVEFFERAIQFESGSADLGPVGLGTARKLAEVLDEVIEPYTRLRGASTAATPERKVWLDAVFIEGHTDNVPLTGLGPSAAQYRDNWGLSAFRAINTHRALVRHRDSLEHRLNGQGQPVLSVSGYASSRPAEGHRYIASTADPRNRRITLRFVMAPEDSALPDAARRAVEDLR